jgi:integrase
LFITGTDEIGKARTKTKRSRTVPMHPKVREQLEALWRGRDCPTSGPVFISSRGSPYADTRGLDGGRQGGNPIKKAHATACRKAGVQGFRVHDWRHHWASWLVMSGCDLYTLMRLGGWQSLRMVQRYAAVNTDHMAEALARVA